MLESVGSTEAYFTVLETINHMLERGSKVLSRFLDICKAFDIVLINDGRNSVQTVL